MRKLNNYICTHIYIYISYFFYISTRYDIIPILSKLYLDLNHHYNIITRIFYIIYIWVCV